MGRSYTSEMIELKETYLWALKTPIESLESFVESSYDLPLLAAGSGGSLTAAHLAALLHEEKTGMVSKGITPLDLVSIRTSLRKTSILFITAEGQNSDILAAFKYAAMSEPRQLMAICTRSQSPLANLTKNFRYAGLLDQDIPTGKDGFLATNSLLATTTILCRGYQDVSRKSFTLPTDLIPEEDFSEILNNSPSLLERNTWVVLYGGWGYPAATDLESKFTEAALGQIQLADYRNFAHGRHYWLAKHGEQTGVICLITPEEEEIASKTIELLPEGIPIIKIFTSHAGPVGAIELLVKILFFVGVVGETKGVDPGRPNVPAFGRKIYHLHIPVKYLKESVPYRLKEEEFVAIKRKIDFNHVMQKDVIDFWQKAYRSFIHKLEHTRFGCIVFDYDGTLCDPNERFSGPSNEIGEALIRLLKGDVILGIATGRGKSVRADMQRLIPEEYWDKLAIGYYNGSDVGLLNDELHPNKNAPLDPFLKELSEILEANTFFKSIAGYELRPKQITVSPKRTHFWYETKKILFDVISKNNLSGIRILESSHSLDIVSANVSKRAFVRIVEKMAGDMNKPKCALCIGDRGEWSGNDYELLNSPYSLSVDYTSPDPNSCWDIAPAGHRGVQATLDYINAIDIKDTYCKINTKAIGTKNER
jgi:hydroxymethylpyrimidine pyrophosphatase-like HAD family hydrolase/fructoselysine-6-P-deglycase FrlB-like protein